MDNLRNLIYKNIECLSEIEIPNEAEREFLKCFLDNYKINDFETYDNVSNAAYLLAVLTSSGIDMPFEELAQNIAKVEDFVNDLLFDVGCYYSYLEELESLKEAGILKKLVYKEKLNITEKKQIRQYQKYVKKVFTSQEGVTFCEVNKVFDKLFLSLPKPEKFKGFIGLESVALKIKDTIEKVVQDGFEECINDEIFSDFERSMFNGRSFNKFVEKEKNKMVKEHIKEFMKFIGVDLEDDYSVINKRFQQISKEDHEVVKSINKKIRALEDLDYKLKYIRTDRLIKMDNNTKELLFDSEIKYNYLLLALSHNYNIYKQEEEKNISFNNNSITKLEILFSKYGFNFNNFSDEEKESIINEVGVLHVESMLNSIKYSDVSFICEYVREFAKVIIFSNPEIIKFIAALLKNKIIDKKFIFKNINILCDTREFKNLYENTNYLSSIGINLNNLVKDNPDVLLLDHERLLTSTNLLAEYKLKLNKEDVYNFDILMNNEMLDLLDNYIELGLKDVVLENPRYLTKEGFDTVKRIMICNLTSINPINKSNKIIGSVSTGNNFYIDPKDYDNFIIDYKEDYQNPICLDVLKNNNRTTISASTKSRIFVQKLDELYMKDDLTYVINGVAISRNRVLRNLEVLLKYLYNNLSVCDLVYQAILYMMINNIEPDVLEGIYNSIYSIDLEIEKDKIYTLSKNCF